MKPKIVRLVVFIFNSWPVVDCFCGDGVSGEGGTHSDGGELQLTQLHTLYGAHTRVIIPVPGEKEKKVMLTLPDLWLWNKDYVKSENLLICIVNKEGEQTNRAAHEDHPDNSVKKVFSIHKVSDAMNGGLL